MATRLKRNYPTQDEIPETFRPLYEEKEGKFVFTGEIEGLVPAQRVDDFRNENIKLKKDHEAELEKYKDVDVDKYHDLKSREQDLEDGKLMKRNELETVRKAAIQEAVKPFLENERKFKDENSALSRKLADAVIGNLVMQEGLKFKMKEGAAGDLKRRALDIFRLDEDGQPKAFNADGTPRYHQGDPLTIEQWIKDTSMAPDGSYMFHGNEGGGGDAHKSAGGSGNGSNEIDPFDPKSINRKLQGEMMMKDFAKAQRMAKRHGIDLPTPVSFVPK